MINRMLLFCSIVLITSLAIVPTASARLCTGHVYDFWTTRTGEFWIEAWFKPDGTVTTIKICSLTSTLNSISPEMCKAWHSDTAVALASGVEIDVIVETSLNCSSLPKDASSAVRPWEFVFARNFKAGNMPATQSFQMK